MKKILSVFLMFTLFLVGCNSKETRTASPVPTNDPINHEALPHVVIEELSEKGLNIEEVLSKEVDDVDDIQSMEYQLIESNFSNKAEKSDFMLELKASRSWWKDNATITTLWCKEFDEYVCVFSQANRYTEFKTLDLTGDGQDELLLITDNSGNSLNESFLAIYTYNGEVREVFNEQVSGGYKKLAAPGVIETIGSINYEVEYSFIANKNGSQDILYEYVLYKKIYEDDGYNESKKGKEVAKGNMRFVFNDGKYVLQGERFDYRKEIERLTWSEYE